MRELETLAHLTAKEVDMTGKSLIFDGNTFDIQYAANGDCVTDELETNIYMAIFGDARASKTDISQSDLRAGFFGTLLGEEFGSKVWLDNGLKTNANLNRLVDYARKSLQFLIDKAIVKKIDVDGTFTDTGAALNIRLTYFNNSNKVVEVNV